MIICITGAPGTGKTTVSNILAKELDIDYVSIKALVKEKKLYIGRDQKRKSLIVDPKKLRKAIQELKLNQAVIDGLLSHYLDLDYCIVLRCEPPELKQRLEKKGWSKQKLQENLESEILGVVTVEAIKEQEWENVYEVDTTAKQPVEIVNEILDMMKGSESYSPKIDWLETYNNWLR